MALYGKYRPQNFANLVGQEHIRQTLLNELQQHTLSHAYLFAGPRGTGKTSTARLIAKALNCTNRNPETMEPCDECEFCIAITEGSLIDVIEIDAASNRGIDEIRDLKEKINFAPTRAKTKTYIIDEVHMLTKEAFNALLKTLEEPPENVYFILCTTEIHKIPETIISRCQRFDFKRIDVKTIMTRLSYIAQLEGIEAQDTAIELIARHVEGGLRDAIGLFEQMIIDGKLDTDHIREHLGITGHQTVLTLIELLQKRELPKAIHLVNEVHNEGYDLTSFVREILECLREKLITDIQQNQGGSAQYLEMIEYFEQARDMLRSTLIPQLPLEIAVIKICGVSELTQDRVDEKEAANPENNDNTSKKSTSDEILQSSDESQKEEEQTAQALKTEYEMEPYTGDLNESWPRILEHVQPPSLRRSLQDGKLSSSDETSVKLIFGSRFHMDKVNLVENRAKIEKAIAHLTGKNLKVICELQKQEIKLPGREDQSVKVLPPLKKKSVNAGAAGKMDVARAAMEIFGEE